MPRVDNDDEYNLDVVRDFGDPRLAPIDFDPTDPGATPPLDVCNYCYESYGLIGDAEHPPYTDDIYKCAICQCRLSDGDG